MSISNAVNRTFVSGQISEGTALDLFGTEQYTGSMAITAITGGSLTISSYNATTNAVTITLSNFPGQTFSGTLLGNTASGILLSITIAALGVTPFAIYLTNATQGIATSVNIADESSSSPVYVACYCRGTSIGTPDGERLVEDLQAGDLVLCLNGGVAPVRWIGRRSYGGRFLRANPQLRPVRFMAGSLGSAQPARDLLVSPKHSMLIDGVLVPAELLVDGVNVVVDTDADTVDYFHVELPQHDAIWAENVLSETFVDDDSRGMFHNAASFDSMYPDAAVAAPQFFAPRVESGAVLDAIRSRLGFQQRPVAVAA